jgi:hypothetical protein
MLIRGGEIIERFEVEDRDDGGRIYGAIKVQLIIQSNENRSDGMSARAQIRTQMQFEDRSAILEPRKTDPESFQVLGSDKVVWKV